jgi:large repetitive protein
MKRSIRTLALLAPILLASPSRAADRPYFDAYVSAPARALPAARSAAPAAFVASRDEQRGVPTFLWAAPAASPLAALAGLGPEAAARIHLERHADRYGLSPAALSTAEVKEIHDTGRGGIIVILRQRVGGVELYHSAARVLMNRQLDLVAIGGNLHAAAVPKLKGAAFSVAPEQAIADAFNDLYGLSIQAKDLLATKKIKADYRYYDLSQTPAVAAQKLHFTTPARAKKVYFPLPDRLVPAYYLELDAGKATSTTSDVYAYVIAADDGRVLYRSNLKHSDTFSYRVWADATGDLRPADGPLLDYTPHPKGISDNTYPGFAAPALIAIDGFNKNPAGKGDPWLPAGATETKGNNVDAYTDDDAPDGFSAGDLRASITAPNTFDRLYDLNAGPQTSDNQRQAAVTDIFYVTNWLHDWWYDSGFNEAAGNAQEDNYGRGGLEGDPLHAEGQDGAPDARDNANMDARSDGESPRMQMYVWDGVSSRTLTVAGQGLSTTAADFAPPNFNVTGDVVLVDDGTGVVTDGCEAFKNDVSGKIALVDRGNCNFKQKGVLAAVAGAVGVILANNKPNQPPPPMGDADPLGPLAIPMMSITQEDGNALKASLQAGPVTATLAGVAAPDRDGTIDNTVVAHEWGHYLHLREVDCGSPMCSAESEGWADFNAILMVLRQGDNLDGTFALAQYATASFQDPGYFGIRRYPYSTDLTKSPLTFKYIADGEPLPAGVPVADTGGPNSEVHNTGEIWAAMLFEAYVALLKQTGSPGAPYTFAEARRRMSDYVVAGMKITPPDPTITEQRDAVLAAALAADPKDFALMAKGFAKRGAGTCAVSPPRQSKDFAGVVESFKLQPNLSLLSVTLDDSVKSCDSDGHLDAGETGRVTAKILNDGNGPLLNTTATIVTTTKGIAFPNGPKATIGMLAPFATATATVDIQLDPSVDSIENLDLQVVIENADACTPKMTSAQDPLINFDEVPASSAVDTVESEAVAWKLDGGVAKSVWGREEDKAPNHVWHGFDFASNSDTALESPLLDVSATDSFVITFDHRHQFETSMGTFWDGGVIEISIDGGKNWADVSKYADPGYGGQIGDSQAHSPLLGRQGYVDHNPSWPANDTVKLDLGKALAGKKVKVRFRIGSDDAQDDVGWFLDNIAFKGITNKPFPAILDNAKPCLVTPVADAGVDQTAASGDIVVLDASASKDPAGGTLTFAWKQTAGPDVALSEAAAVMTKFTAPAVTAETTLTFQVTASDGKGSASDSVDVRVLPRSSTGTDGAGGGGVGGGATSGGAALTPGGGCGCEAAGSGGDAAPFASLLGLALLGLRRRRRG